MVSNRKVQSVPRRCDGRFNQNIQSIHDQAAGVWRWKHGKFCASDQQRLSSGLAQMPRYRHIIFLLLVTLFAGLDGLDGPQKPLFMGRIRKDRSACSIRALYSPTSRTAGEASMPIRRGPPESLSMASCTMSSSGIRTARAIAGK